MRLWIDADAAPREMKDIIFRAGKRLAIETILVANQSPPIPAAYPNARVIVVDGSADAADRRIVQEAIAGDVVITADIALAAQLVAKQVAVIDPRGSEYTEDDAQSRLSVRNFMDFLRGAGVSTGGPRPYGTRDLQAFAATLDRLLTRAVARERRTPPVPAPSGTAEPARGPTLSTDAGPAPSAPATTPPLPTEDP